MAVIVVVSVVLLLAVALVAFTTATLKQANSLRNVCWCMWAIRLQRGHYQRWHVQHSEVRATFSAPFYVNEASWPLRKRGHSPANLSGGLTVDVALDHRYRSTRFCHLSGWRVHVSWH